MTAETPETLLIVEDDVSLREALHEILESHGFQVFAARHGRDALLILAEIQPDLIISDIAMPVMDGLSLFNAIRQRPEWISIPFIFLTARGERQQIMSAKDLGVEEYLVKPVDTEELLRTIQARLNRSRQLRLAQIQESYEASLTMLANAIEVRDQYTRGHVERVTSYAVAIAREIKPEKQFIQDVRFGAILHDIGKIHVRESILVKNSPLTEAEWAEMRRHPVTGAEMIKDIPFLIPAIPAVRHHHERWDGKGYPAGLSGTDIPLSARTVAIADSLDAMTTNRPYQAALSPESAYLEIVTNAGTLYDPAVVNAFQKAWAKRKIMVSEFF